MVGGAVALYVYNVVAFTFFKHHLYKNYKVLQGGILSALMFGSLLALIQALSERDVFGGVNGGVLSYSPI